MNTDLLALADHFALAAIDDAEWLPALKSMAALTGSPFGQLIGFGGSTPVPFNWINDIPTEVIDQFVSQERGDPDMNVRVRASLSDPAFVVRSEEDYRAVGPGGGFDIYRDMCHELGISNGCQMKLVDVDGMMVGMSIQRSEREGETTAEERAIFAAIAPHVRSAFRMRIALQGQGALLLRDALDQVGLAAFICGADASVKARTARADDFLASGLLRIVDGRLTAPSPKDDKLLRGAIAKHHLALAPACATLMLQMPLRQMPVILDICRCPARPGQINFASEVLVVVRSGKRWHDAAPAVLRSVFGLSPAEIDVALRLARGENREMIAEQRRTSGQTTKAQLKSIFAKLGISREAEVVAMLHDIFAL